MSKKATTAEQFEVLVAEMELNPDVARGAATFGSSKAAVDSFWEETALKLNGLGPPSRTASEWRKVWTDLKGRLKKKIANNRQNYIQTGGGPCQYSELTPLEQTVDKIVNLNAAANPSGNVYGIKNPKPTPSPNPLTDNFEEVSLEEIDTTYLEVEVLETFPSLSSIQETPATSKTTSKRKRISKSDEKSKFLKLAEQQVEGMDRMTSAMLVLADALNAHKEILEKNLERDK